MLLIMSSSSPSTSAKPDRNDSGIWFGSLMVLFSLICFAGMFIGMFPPKFYIVFFLMGAGFLVAALKLFRVF